jgi:hypothetical protein
MTVSLDTWYAHSRKGKRWLETMTPTEAGTSVGVYNSSRHDGHQQEPRWSCGHLITNKDNRTMFSSHLVVHSASYSPTPPPGTPVALTCHRCGAIDRPQYSPGKGPLAMSALCQHCGSLIQWISQYTPSERRQRREAGQQAAMAAKAPSPEQLRYLQPLGDCGPTPATMAEASTRIDAARARKGGGR